MPAAIGAAVGLGIVFDKFQIILLTEGKDLFRTGASSVQVYKEDGPGAIGDGFFHAGIIQFQRTGIRFHQHCLQPIFRDGEYGRNVRIGRDNDFVPGPHDSQFDVGAINPDQGVKAVPASDAVPSSDIIGIMPFELFVLLALEIPAAFHDPTGRFPDFFSVQRGYVF